MTGLVCSMRAEATSGVCVGYQCMSGVTDPFLADTDYDGDGLPNGTEADLQPLFDDLPEPRPSNGLATTASFSPPPWAGATAAAVSVGATVMLGGMRSITFVQAFQYWLKLTALAVPLVFLLHAWRGDGSPGILG